MLACEGCAEICCELGTYYLETGDADEAVLWFYNGAYETESILNVRCSGCIPLEGLAECYHALGDKQQEEEYRRLAKEWEPPFA